MLVHPFAWLMTEHLLLFGAVPLLLLATTELGFRLGRWRASRHTANERELGGVGAITTGLVRLLAFTLGLTISFAQNRFEVRRELGVTEANAIGTAWLRARLIGGETGATLAGASRITRLACASARSVIAAGQDHRGISAAAAAVIRPAAPLSSPRVSGAGRLPHRNSRGRARWLWRF